MTENEIAKTVLDAAFLVHTKLGSGLLESVYEVVLAHESRKVGLIVERQKAMPIMYDGLLFEEGYRADLLVEGLVIVELKSIAAITSVHGKQLLTQLRLSGLKLGLLINFGESHLKDGIRRIINGDLAGEDDREEITL
jgi:GxxExxY protein